MSDRADRQIASDRGHSIKIVSQKTGLSPHVIRVWELRYQAVNPRRTPTNRRLYSDEDIAKLRLLASATGTGHTISNIASLSTPELESLVNEDASETPPPASSPENPSLHLSNAIDATRNLDARALQVTLERASVHLTQLVLLEEVVIPLMRKIGDMWHEGKLRVVHEHTAYAVVSAFVSSMKTAYASTADAPTVVVATPAGQLHELGSLVVAATAASEGWNPAYLGASLPAEEIAKAAEHHDGRVVALSIIYPADDPTLPDELRKLRRLLPESVSLLIGGRAAESYESTIEELGATFSRDLESVRQHLSNARNTK